MSNSVKRVVIPAGTVLYRSAPIIELRPVHYEDIQKVGIVFSTYPFFELARALVRKRPSRLGVYQLTRDIEVLVGRHSFRKLDKKLYYSNGKAIEDYPAEPRHNLSHLDTDIYPEFHSKKYDKLLSSRNYRSLLGLKATDGEVFIGQTEHVAALRLIREYMIPLQGLETILERENYQATSSEYFGHLRLVKQGVNDVGRRNWDAPVQINTFTYVPPEATKYKYMNQNSKKYVTIPAGTYLYRAAPKIEKRLMYSHETGKYGLHFATYMFLALATVVEQKESMRLGIFRLNKDIRVVKGKYSGRKGENRSHFDPDIYAILDDTAGIKYDLTTRRVLGLGNLDGELFIGELDHLDGIELVAEYFVPYQGLMKLLREEKFKPYSTKYIEHMEFIS